ncbi:MAG: hypothetical protein ICV51_19590, partial [Flavisolibacter sp.]|nr:hypothetical protein [Flavisolibacter sp.]
SLVFAPEFFTGPALPCYLLPCSSLSGARTAFQQVQEADGVANNGFALAALQCPSCSTVSLMAFWYDDQSER